MDDIVDPLTLEPIVNAERLLVFNCGESKICYDFDFFYNNIHKLNDIIPHTGEHLTEKQKAQFNKICRDFNVSPAFPLISDNTNLDFRDLVVGMMCAIVVTLIF